MGNVTNLRLASPVPYVVGFLEGFLVGDLVVQYVREVKEVLSKVYKPEDIEIVTWNSSFKH